MIANRNLFGLQLYRLKKEVLKINTAKRIIIKYINWLCCGIFLYYHVYGDISYIVSEAKEVLN